LAVAVTLATPDAFVTAVPLERAALAPTGGAAKVTVTPLSGLPRESFTVACNAIENAVLNDADWGVPPVAVMEAGGPTVLVKENEADSAPITAVTV
jgi:hypothetical protein